MVKTNRADALRLRLVVTEHQERMGRRMRARREELQLSRDEVARRMGDKTNGNAIYRYEVGEVTPGAKKLDLLAKALETQVAAFLVDPPATEDTPDLMGALNGDADKLDEILATLKLLVERQGALEAAVAELAEHIAAALPAAQPKRRRASGR